MLGIKVNIDDEEQIIYSSSLWKKGDVQALALYIITGEPERISKQTEEELFDEDFINTLSFCVKRFDKKAVKIINIPE